MITDTQSFITGEHFEHSSRVQRIKEHHTIHTVQETQFFLGVFEFLLTRCTNNIVLSFLIRLCHFLAQRQERHSFHITCFLALNRVMLYPCWLLNTCWRRALRMDTMLKISTLVPAVVSAAFTSLEKLQDGFPLNQTSFLSICLTWLPFTDPDMRYTVNTANPVHANT